MSSAPVLDDYDYSGGLARSHRAKRLLQAFSRAVRPDIRELPSEWSANNRILDKVSSNESGRWNNDRTPYLVEIMDAAGEDDPCQEIVFIKGAQLGGTEALNNILGAIMDQRPCPMMMILPTVDLAEYWSKNRLTPMIESTPSLRNKIDLSSRKGGNTILSKKFPGGQLRIVGANSPVGLRSAPCQVIGMDEVDGFPRDVGGEGCPVKLAEARARTFPNRKIIKVSTPTTDETSRIQRAFEASDQRFYHVPCPKCDHQQTIEFEALVYDPEVVERGEYPQDVYLKCSGCNLLISENYKTQMLAGGRWKKRSPKSKIAGFHLSSLYSPSGWYSWRECIQEYLDALKEGDGALRVFFNTVLGRTWKVMGDAPEWEILFGRRESYKIGVVPEGGLVLTSGVDIQKDRIELEVVAWGRGMESWSVDYKVLHGETSDMQVWEDLSVALRTTYPSEAGHYLPIYMSCVDTGYNTTQVYGFLAAMSSRIIVGVKGQDTTLVPIGNSTKAEVSIDGRKLKNGATFFNIGSSVLKESVYGALKLNVQSGGVYPPRYCHFPEYGEEFFKQLTSEQMRITKDSRNRDKVSWHKTRDRNEALDTRVYALAAAMIAGVNRFDERSWAAVENPNLYQKIININPVERVAAGVAESAATPAPQVQQQQRPRPKKRQYKYNM